MQSLLVVVLSIALVGQAGDEPSKEDVVPLLQKGGYVLFIRHPKTNEDQADTDPLHLENVKAQRQLTDEGRKQAKAIGDALRSLKVPVDRVTASRFYRAQEAAKLLDLGEVETSLDVTEGGLVVSPRENQRRSQALRLRLATPPAPGKNSVIVSHKPNLQDAAGKEFGDIGEAEVVVFQPMGNGKFKQIARIPFATWDKWTK